MASLNWDDFFILKQKIAKARKLAGIPAILGFLFGEIAFLSLPVFNPMQTIFGFDPLVVIAAGTISGCAASFVMGSALAENIYRRLLGSRIKQFDRVNTYIFFRCSWIFINEYLGIEQMLPPIQQKLAFPLIFTVKKLTQLRDIGIGLETKGNLSKNAILELQ